MSLFVYNLCSWIAIMSSIFLVQPKVLKLYVDILSGVWSRTLALSIIRDLLFCSLDVIGLSLEFCWLNGSQSKWPLVVYVISSAPSRTDWVSRHHRYHFRFYSITTVTLKLGFKRGLRSKIDISVKIILNVFKCLTASLALQETFFFFVVSPFLFILIGVLSNLLCCQMGTNAFILLSRSNTSKKKDFKVIAVSLGLIV